MANDPRIRATFISRKSGEIIGDAQVIVPPPEPISAFTSFLNSVNPFSSEEVPKKIAPRPSVLSYSVDLFNFTDAFDFTISLAPDETFKIQSHDFVEFSIVHNDRFHQIGVGLLESFVKETTSTEKTFKANGRDLMGQFMTIPFNVQLKEKLTIRRFIDRMIRGSYLEEYINLRQSGRGPIRDIGSFQPGMLFFSDLEQMKAQVLQQYAELAINLVYMNRLGQIEILGRAGTFGSTAPPRTRSPIGLLKKGLNVETFRVMQNYTEVLSEFTLFYSSGEGIQDRNTILSPKFENSDQRVKGHIFQPGYRTFATQDLVTIGGEVNFARRVNNIATSIIRKSNRNLNAVVAIVSEPFFRLADDFEVAYEVGQLFVLQSNEREFTSPSSPDGTDTVRMIITGIHYAQTPTSLQTQLRFHEVETLL